MNKTEYSTIAVLDTIEDKLIPQSLELIAFADNLADSDLSHTLLILTGRNIKSICDSISSKYGVDTAYVEHDDLYLPNPELLTDVLHEVIKEYQPETVLLTHTIRNCQTAAKLSVLFKASSITAVESFTKIDEESIFQRSIFNGKFKMRVSPRTPLKILTVLPGAYTQGVERGSNIKDGSIIDLKFPGIPASPIGAKHTGSEGYKPLSLLPVTESDVKLEEADVIISAGRGIGKEENLSLIRETASIFGNAAVGASRPVCDQRWLPLNHQVGITGKTVSPKLYMACGISGSQQHIAGMKNSQCIVAVNKDPNAAIFSVADYIIVEDITLFLPVLVKKYRQRYDQ
jgi:electron transfer flavoprotein alpha subunit